MLKKAILIESLNMCYVYVDGPNDYFKSRSVERKRGAKICDFKNGCERVEELVKVKTDLQPVHLFSEDINGEKLDKYIIYSREVQELLEIPYKTYKEELWIKEKLLKKQIKKNEEILGMGLLDRLKFLFGMYNVRTNV